MLLHQAVGKDLGQELGQSVEEAIREAMNTSIASASPSSPPTMAMPQPHLPLRKSSVQALHQRRTAPRPLLATSKNNQLRGFNPTLVHPMPHIDNATASSEHAFAGRHAKRSSKLPLDVHALGYTPDNFPPDLEWPLSNNGGSNPSRPPSSPLSSPATSPTKATALRPSKSVGDGLRGKRRSTPRRSPPHALDISSVVSRPSINANGQRASVRSGLTSSSSMLHTGSLHTDRSSQATGNSSTSDFVFVRAESDCGEEDLSVEDAIGMYENGFGSAKPSMEIQHVSSNIESSERPSSSPGPHAKKPTRPSPLHRRSQSATALLTWQSPTSRNQSQTQHQSSLATETRVDSRLVIPEIVSRDRYGFKKASHHISVEQYDAWNSRYVEYLERRTSKWNALMRSYGLSTESPLRFPPKGDKIKRYVRKGIPPHLRGAAWFWYGGGPGQLAKNPGLYKRLLDLVDNNKLSDLDREHIERDLNRTFPDNVQFKPDPVAGQETARQTSWGGNRRSTEPETPMVRALRRVLQAFAVYNPQIGYCQSLNFIAGLLLLFLDRDEEKAFTLLNIVTSTHLPGTHGIALEGANIDIAVLMSCIQDSLPGVWTKLDDKGGGTVGNSSTQALRLPTVSLATTAWFMSLFVGTLPIESVLRVWDCLFFEGSKTLFRIALAIFKAGEKEILAVSDPMEIFQVVQTIPRSMLDINGLMDVCFRRRGGFGHVSQGLIEQRRDERRAAVRDGVADLTGGKSRWTRRWRSRTKA